MSVYVQNGLSGQIYKSLPFLLIFIPVFVSNKYVSQPLTFDANLFRLCLLVLKANSKFYFRS